MIASRQTSSLMILFVAITSGMLTGCGSGVTVVPVSGTVTFSGKPPPHECIVNFLPTGVALTGGQGKEAVPQVASGIGECDSSGDFSARSLRDRVGLVPSRYEVVISCFVPNYKTDAPPVSVVPSGFTPPELVVPADARSVHYDVDIPATAKPKQ